jgi:UDP-N-acetyl-2-amino-2-deoxyglucuronate dehydrogenase
MSARSIRAGVIGLGVGEQHLRSYSAIADCEVVSVCDINPVQLQDVADRWNVSGRHTDFRKITENPDIDVVSICSYDDAHVEQAISAFEHGKHVMVEKPVALHKADAERVLRAQQDSGKLITSNLILRRSPRFQELRQQIQTGDLGEIFHIEGDYVHQILWKITEGWRGQMDFYNTFYGGGIHLVDLMRWLTGFEYEEVCAMGNDILTRKTSYKYPDTISALLKFDSGATAKCATMYGPQRTKFHALNVYGSKATFVNDLPDGKFFTSDEPEDERAVTTAYPGMKKGDMLPGLIEAIRTGGRPEVDARDIFRIMDVCFAVWEAVQSRRTISISYLI